MAAPPPTLGAGQQRDLSSAWAAWAPRCLGREHRAACPQPWPAYAQHPASSPAPTLSPGYGELPDLESEALQKQADHCNDRRMASKRVQELSTGLFFAILVKVRPPPVPPLPLLHPTSPPGHRLTGSSQGAQGPPAAGVGPGGDATSRGQASARALPCRKAAPWSRKPWCWAS